MQADKEMSEHRSKEVSLKDIVLRGQEWGRYILSKWLLIGLVGLVFGLLGYTYAYFKKPAYVAATTFVLEDGGEGGALGQYAGLAAMAGVDLNGGGGNIFQGDNIMELYKSRSMIEKALLSPVKGSEQLLIDHYIEVNGLREQWKEKPALAGINFSPSEAGFSRVQDSVIGTIVKDINKNYLYVSKPDKKLSILKVEVLAKDESFSKAFNDQIVQTVNEFYIQTKTKKSLDNLHILQDQTDSVRRVLSGDIYRGASSIDATPNLNPTRQVQRIAPMQQAQVAAETNKAVLAELVKNLELTKMTLLKETPLIQIIDTPKYPLEKKVTSKILFFILFGFIGVFITVSVLLGRKILEAIMR